MFDRPASWLVAALVVSFVLAACGSSSGEPRTVADSDLPAAEVSALAEVPDTPQALVESGATVVLGRLVEVEDAYRFRGGSEDLALGFVEEKLGLRFEVLDTLMGPDPGPTVMVEVPGYHADPDSKQRIRRVVINGVDPTREWTVDNEYVFSIVPLEDHYWFNAFDLVARVGPDGELQPIADPPPVGYRDILTVADARRIFAAAVATG